MRKMGILLIPTLALCFAIGFGLGAYPQLIRQMLGQESETLLILASDSRLIPYQFLLDYEKATGHSVQVVQIESYHLFRTEAKNADLLFAPLSWLSQFPENLKTLPDQDEFRELLSSDFRTLKLELDFFLPLIWKTENRDNKTHLMIWGFATPQEDLDHSTEFLQYLLTSHSRLKDWAHQIQGLSFTLQASNEIEDFPEDQRAQKFREVSLSNLQIDQSPKE